MFGLALPRRGGLLPMFQKVGKTLLLALQVLTVLLFVTLSLVGYYYRIKEDKKMTHQYVGAYYVPHGWYENYDPEFQYDPLSTVFYKNAWYILKQPAPVGTVPTDTKYWAQYNLVPGQITDIISELNEINSKINESQTLKNRNIILVGDSFMVGNSSLNIVGWGELVKNELEKLGATVTLLGDGGYGLIAFDNKTFISLLQSYEGNKNVVTDIFIAGGGNDNTKSTESLLTANTALYNYIIANFPNADAKISWLLYTGETKLNAINGYRNGDISFVGLWDYIITPSLRRVDDYFHLKDYSVMSQGIIDYFIRGKNNDRPRNSQLILQSGVNATFYNVSNLSLVFRQTYLDEGNVLTGVEGTFQLLNTITAFPVKIADYQARNEFYDPFQNATNNKCIRIPLANENLVLILTSNEIYIGRMSASPQTPDTQSHYIHGSTVSNLLDSLTN